MSRGQWGGAFPVYKHCSGIYPESWRCLPDNDLVTLPLLVLFLQSMERTSVEAMRADPALRQAYGGYD